VDLISTNKTNKLPSFIDRLLSVFWLGGYEL
jgi:hypothetical protein